MNPLQGRRPVPAMVAFTLMVSAMVFVGPSPAVAASAPSFKGVTTTSRLGVSTWAAPKPATTSAGDVLVGLVTVNHSSVSAITPPSGWSLRCHKAGGSAGAPLVQAVYLHLAGSSEPASYTWSFPSNSGVVIAILDYGGVDPMSPVGGCLGQTGAGTNVVVAPALATPVVHKTVVSAFAFRGSGTTTGPAGLAERFDNMTAPDSDGRSVSASAADYASSAGGTLSSRSATASLAAPSAVVGLQFWLRPSFLFIERFTYPDGPITSSSPVWNVTSGSLRARSSMGWTDSAVFRAVTRRNDFGNVHVSMTMRVNQLASSSAQPAPSADGVHLMLRYQSEHSLYYASVNRRDGKVVLKRKCPGGPSNDGTYYELGGYVSKPWTEDAWQHVAASVRTNTNGTVTVSLYREGVLVTSGTDSGHPASATSPACAPITSPGSFGIRADSVDVDFDDVGVSAL